MKYFKNLAILIMALAIVCLSGCGKATPNNAPSPSPTPSESEVPVPTGPIEIDSAIVGQWVPVGVTGSGYMKFDADGGMMRFTERENDEPLIEEQKYYLTSDKTFRMIHKSGKVSAEYEFEVINDGQTLNIYDLSNSLRMASEFYRVD